jgi:hypothetical protein
MPDVEDSGIVLRAVMSPILLLSVQNQAVAVPPIAGGHRMSVSFDGQLRSPDGAVLIDSVKCTGVPVPGPPPLRWNGVFNVPAGILGVVADDRLDLQLPGGRLIEIVVTEVLDGTVRFRGDGVLPY